MLRRLPRTPSGTEFLDTLRGSPSFAVFGDRIRHEFEVGGRARHAPWPLRRLGQSRTTAVLVLLLAHHLGRVSVDTPALLRDRRRALLVGWEVDELTDLLSEELSGGDVLLGISEFNSGVYRRHFPDVPVITVPVCPPFPERPDADRARWGIPDDAIVFLNVFNPVSGFDRKNPIDVYEAFERAFPGRTDVRLVFKVHGGFAKNPDDAGLGGEEQRARAFLAHCAGDERVILVDDFLDYADVVTLVASCDVYVSLARAEGLGLPVLEAMALGVPTICMDYSGHADFVSAEGSLLVPYDLVDIADDASHYYNPRFYSVSPRWAQPRLHEAAEMMSRLADEPALRRRLSEGAVIAAAAYRRRCTDSTWLQDLETALCCPDVIARHASKEREFRRVAIRDRDEWSAHHKRVRRARRTLAVRTRLGRIRRRLSTGLVRLRTR